MSIPIEDILLNHGVGAGSSLNIIKSEVEPSGSVKEGTFWYRLSDGQVKFYLSGSFRAIGGGSTSGTMLTTLVGQTITASVTNTALVAVPSFNPEKDLLFVSQNTTQLTPTIDYVLNKGTKSIQKVSGVWDVGTALSYVVIANTTATSYDSITVAQFEDRTTATTGSANVQFNLEMFNPLTDALNVHRNNIGIFRVYDWTLGTDGRSIDLVKVAEAGDVFHFTLTKKIRDSSDDGPAGAIDGSLLINGTVPISKINFSVVSKVNKLSPDITGNIDLGADDILTPAGIGLYSSSNVQDVLKEAGNYLTDLQTIKGDKDVNGIFKTITSRRKGDDSVFSVSVLSEGTSPLYGKRTVTYYGTNGTTVKRVVVFSLTYDADGDLISEL